LKSSGWGLEKSKLPWVQNFFITIDVFSLEVLANQVSLVCPANWQRYNVALYTCILEPQRKYYRTERVI